MLSVASLTLLIGTASAGSLRIEHQPADCLIKDRFARIEATIEPVDVVASVRVYFKATLGGDYYYVPMTLSLGRFGAKLPKPREKASPVIYYIEALDADGAAHRSADISAQVVKKAEACAEGGHVADEAEPGDVQIFSIARSKEKPKAFAGVTRVVPSEEKPGVTAAVQAETQPLAVEPAPGATPTPSPAPPAQEAARAAAPAETEYMIGPEDILKVTVYGHDDLNQMIVVQSDGTFIFPLIGRIKASDLTPKELERKITTLLGQGFVRNPQVIVTVQEYRSKSVFVVGEVSRPGPYPLAGNMTLVEMLAKAGPTAGAGTEVVIVRPAAEVKGPVLPDQVGGEGDPTRRAEVIRVNIRDIQMGQLEKNIVLRPNDTVFVTQAAKVFITGEVRNPGAFTFSPGMSVRQAISMAGGFTPDASHGGLRVVREVEGKVKELKVKIDEPLQPGDTIIVKAKLF